MADKMRVHYQVYPAIVFLCLTLGDFTASQSAEWNYKKSPFSPTEAEFERMLDEAGAADREKSATERFIDALNGGFYTGPESGLKVKRVAISSLGGLVIEVPSNWKLMTKQQRATIDTFVKKKAPALRKSGIPFMATLYSPKGEIRAAASIRQYGEGGRMKITQADIRAANKAEVKLLGSAFRKGLEAAEKIFGPKLIRWLGTKREKIGDFVAIVSRYKYRNPHEKIVRFMRRIRIYDGSRSFSLLLSCDDKQKATLMPLLDRIAGTL